MACEISMLNSSSNELGTIKFLHPSVFSRETFRFFWAKAVFPESI